MVRIAPVALRYNLNLLWFDPGELEIHDGDTVLVHTDKGLSFGISKEVREVDETELSRLKSKLKRVERVADEQDLRQIEELRQRGREALPRFKEIAAEFNEDMHPVMVEYLFNGDRAMFFFESEERVDFRDLVRRLASEFHVRVDMRQIGVRDKARLVGGLGHCGQELCCRRLGGGFNPVSIRMAKEQDLSLNPQKISGLCGRLMCCLRYEYDAYKDFKSRAPKQNAKISTPHGAAKVVSLDTLREQVTVRVEGEDKNVKFPLGEMDPVPEDAESKRPNSIGEAFETYANPDPFAGTGAMGSFDTVGFTQESKLGTAEAHHNGPARRRSGGTGEQSSQGRKRQRRGGRSRSGKGSEAQRSNRTRNASRDSGSRSTRNAPVGETSHRKRRRRHGSVEGAAAGTAGAEQGASAQADSRPRPGHKSSSLAHEGGRRKRRGAASEASGGGAKQRSGNGGNGNGSGNGSGGGNRRRRRGSGGKTRDKGDGGNGSSTS